jgi:predicted transcriptional regulator
MNLGFAGLEAEVYAALLGEPSATGYRIAQLIGKPVANTYKAIETLAQKGVVMAEDGPTRLYRAIPAPELLAQLDRKFQEHRQQAEQALADLERPSQDDRIYRLQSADQVFERCRNMLSACRQVALLDIFPQPLLTLRGDVEQAAARGVQVALKVYEAVQVAGAEILVQTDGHATLQRWPGQWVNLAVDGNEFLLALLRSDCVGVHQAVWSGSAYLSWIYFNGLSSELVVTGLDRAIREHPAPIELRRLLARLRRLFAPEAPGYQVLSRRFGSSP